MNSVNKDLTNKKNLFKSMNKDTIISVLFTFLAIGFSALVATGFRFDLSTFSDVMYYIRTAISVAIMLYAYNSYKISTIRKEKKKAEEKDDAGKPKTSYGKSKALLGKLKGYYRINHYEDIIIQAVKDANEEARKEACQNLLNQVTYGISLSDLENMNKVDDKTKKTLFDLDEFIKSRRLTKKEVKKLNTAIYQVLNSKVYYELINSHDLLVDTSLDKKVSSKQMTFDESKANLNENGIKLIKFLLSGAVTATLIWNGISPAFWAYLLSQTVLILSSTYSGIMAGYQRINTLQLVTDNQCDFLNTALKQQLINKPLE